MENNKFIENSSERILRCLQDYSNDFMAIEIIFRSSGIDGVRKLIKDGYRISTVENYLQKYRTEGRKTISLEDQKDSIFIEKAQILNNLANKINSLGENVDERTISETIEVVKRIIYN